MIVMSEIKIKIFTSQSSVVVLVKLILEICIVWEDLHKYKVATLQRVHICFFNM